MSDDFGTVYAAQLRAKTKLHAREKRALRIIDGPVSARRTSFLKRAEARVVDKHGADLPRTASGDVAWENVAAPDWKTIMEFLIKILEMLFKLFMAKPPAKKRK